ncbi:MAG: glycosyltransferase [Geminicoccaceae bacterium]|nr:glycosyltransferase [Geminicoccaceae bacterium]
MMEAPFDIVLVGDPRFPGGTASAMAEEAAAAARAGYRVGLVAAESSVLRFPHPFNPKLRALIDGGALALVPPGARAAAGLALLHGPFAAGLLPFAGLGLRAERRLLVLHQPPADAGGRPYYDLARVRVHAEEMLDGAVTLAPVGPLVRAQLDALPERPPMLPFDWHNVIDGDAWAGPLRRPGRGRCVVGRHSRPDPQKWPGTRDAILAAYPDDGRFLVRVLGGGPYLEAILGRYPANWEVLPFGAVDPAQFLKGLDLFVYLHRDDWVEAFGYAVIEAMASGLPCILDERLAPLFGEAALCLPPERAADAALALFHDPARYHAQALAGMDLVAERFSRAALARRLHGLVGPPAARPVPASTDAATGAPVVVGRARLRALFLSSNGVGMGHLTRLLAVARRLPPHVQPVFATMSQAIGVVDAMGYMVEHLPFHRYLGCDVAAWNRHLRDEIGELIAAYRPAVLVFDGNGPYQGLIDACDRHPQIWRVWCRRGMWGPGTGETFIRREKHFDAVLEPADLAEAFDRGPTPSSRARTRRVEPMRLLDEEDCLPRAEARAELGLDPDRPAVLVQLGSGNNFAYETVRRLVLERLAAGGGVQVVLAEWLIAENGTGLLPEGVRRLRAYPFARLFDAFDASVAAVGYNGFHECVQAGLPTLFIPNENPEQDDQLGRARFAERHGLALALRAHEVYAVAPAIERLLDPGEQRAMRGRCEAFRRPNGALEAARFVEELCHLRRGER